VLGAALFLSLLLYLIFQAAQRRLTRQTADLEQAGRRDALTGLLNHGTTVALLAEYAIVKQQVALGDSIVRDVPNAGLVRAGVRHHHERWDGSGYLDGLTGEEIPLIARILPVGDAFSR
jgi:HD-GYP domain-containing protein (c-di-GMP phosphodiesterase class II)